MSADRNGIYIALGANLPSSHGAPKKTLEAALTTLARKGVAILQRSSWWRSAPQPASAQPDFINGVAEISTTLAPRDLLTLLHGIEADFGRVRSERWAARVLDLDLLDYRAVRVDEEGVCLPHPRLQERLFVLLPLQEVAPNWRHPVTGEKLDDLLRHADPLNINKL